MQEGFLPNAHITDPKGPETGERIVIRGGSYSNTASRACSSARFCNTLTNKCNNIGFRLARAT